MDKTTGSAEHAGSRDVIFANRVGSDSQNLVTVSAGIAIDTRSTPIIFTQGDCFYVEYMGRCDRSWNYWNTVSSLAMIQPMGVAIVAEHASVSVRALSL